MIATEHLFKTWDGVELFYRAWLPVEPPTKALLLFHRGHEHSGRWEEVVDLLQLDDVAIFALDARGHGRSPGERGAAPSLLAVIKDTDAFARHVSARHDINLENMIVLGHSVGAVTTAAWVHDYAPPIRAMILATAAFRVRLYLPLAIPALRWKQQKLGDGFVKSYVKAKMLTHDSEQAARYDSDPLIFRQIAINILLDLHDIGTRLLADAGAIHLPTLMLGAGSDWVVRLDAQRDFFNGLSSPFKRMYVFPAAYHSLFHEKDRGRVIERTRDFILDRFAQPASAISLRDADKYGYTWEEYERLKLRGAPQFLLARAAMKLAGRWSKGINLGWRNGFDSGTSLDYVYENVPQGSSRLGKLIDAKYLNSAGWRGIRQRRVNLESALRRLIQETHAAGRRVHIVDIAAGSGRYLLETMKELAPIPMSALLRDYRQENLEAARNLAERFGLTNVATETGNAFDRRSLATINARPTIVVVSGLYELFPSNEAVRESLAGLADAIEWGGYLIYTNQPWHPQIEFIARVLRNREGQPWIMRRRSTAEMDQLVREAGFEKITMEIDQGGMFTVSIARRLASLGNCATNVI